MRTGCGAADPFSGMFSTERRLDDLVIAEKGFEGLQQLGRVPFRGTFDPPQHSSLPIDQEAGRQTLDFEGPFGAALGIEIGLDGFEPELAEERLDGLAAAAVL